MNPYDLMILWRSRAGDRMNMIREAELKIKRLEAANASLIVEAQRCAADAKIWETKYKNLSANKINGFGEV